MGYGEHYGRAYGTSPDAPLPPEEGYGSGGYGETPYGESPEEDEPLPDPGTQDPIVRLDVRAEPKPALDAAALDNFNFAGRSGQVKDPTGVPWRLDDLRIEALGGEGEALPPVVPGRDETYVLYLLELEAAHPGSAANVATHAERWTALRSRLRNTGNVAFPSPPGRGPYVVETHDGASLLARLEPLAPGIDAVTTDGSEPPTRDSAYEGRWVVITGGRDRTPAPDVAGVTLFELETKTIESTARYPTREAVVNAFFPRQ